MEFLQEKRNRQYMVFVGGGCAVLLFFSLFLGICQERERRTIFLQWEKTVSSAMLKQGMGEGQISEVLQSREVTEEGEKLLEKLGHMEKENLWLLETGGKNNFLFGIVLAAGSFLAVFWFLGGAGVFLLQRERQYEKAVKIIEGFQKGETERRLPGNDTGGIYRLFSSVNCLATAFGAREEAAQKAKDFLKNMVSDISHQLKTPLAALNMYMEIMMEDKEAVEVFGEKAILSLERMERLTENLLKIVRFDAKTISFEKKTCDVGGLVKDAAEGFITRAEKEGKKLFLEGEETILNCDRSWTEEAVSNLIKNALDHTDRGDFVKISWEKSPVMIRISVEDNGSGISEEDIYHIFKRFYRSSSSGGSGLGLPLAKAIVEGQGGNLTVSSQEGKGSTFVISFSYMTEL
ncbi:MAG: HAMP domain-containing sensor histidine kinase [Eubacteriales bacterium]|nr:HAMP domain-containing sensor histidine kinase [Eubacteriales bacterium]